MEVGLKEFAENMLDIAYQTFALKTSYFDRLGQSDWANAGIENWVQVELSLALMVREIPVTTIGKRKRDCDLIIGNYAVELRCATTAIYYWYLLKAIEDHPKAKLYVFLSKMNDKFMEEVKSYCEKNGYIEKHKMLNTEWVVMVVRKNAGINP